MEHELFEEPVTIFVGLNFHKDAATVSEAYALLSEWSGVQRGSAHSLALNACKAAFAREVDAETVRGAFAAFTRRNGILAPDMDELIAARATGALPEHRTN